MARRRVAGLLGVALLVTLSLLAGWGAGMLYQPVVAALSLPGWPWWGPRVRVGEREFRPNIRVKPDVAVRLVVWDVEQPALRASGGWQSVLSEAVSAFQARYPNVTVTTRILSWTEFGRAVTEAFEKGEPPDILGTPDAIYRFDARFQVPLQRYIEPRLPSDPSQALLPGALQLASQGDELWAVPRWVEWYGWVKRAQSEGSRRWLDAGSPLTWRYLAMTLTPPGDESIWQRSRLEASAAWMASARLSGGRVRSGVPLRRPDLSVLEPLYSGEADAVGPVSGRLLLRLGWWPYPEAPVPRAALVAAPFDETERERLPGPLLTASGYTVFARTEADDVRLQVAAELALHLAWWTSRAISGREGVIPLWNPAWDESAPRRRRPPETEEPPWWHEMSFPPGAMPLLAAPIDEGQARCSRPGADGQGGALVPAGPALWGARPWEEALHEERVVREAAAKLASGRLELTDFVKQVAHPFAQSGPGPGSDPVR